SDPINVTSRVEPTDQSDAARDHGPHLGVVGIVDAYRHTADFIRGDPRAAFVHVGDHDLRAARGDHSRRRLPDATRPARDERGSHAKSPCARRYGPDRTTMPFCATGSHVHSASAASPIRWTGSHHSAGSRITPFTPL